MNPEKQRIAIAEVCGWKDIHDNTNNVLAPDGVRHFYSLDQYWGDFVPDYLHDLNAMHEAEKAIKVRATNAPGCPWRLYETMLARIVPGDCGMFHITASQRAEAFLKAIGKWTDA